MLNFKHLRTHPGEDGMQEVSHNQSGTKTLMEAVSISHDKMKDLWLSHDIHSSLFLLRRST